MFTTACSNAPIGFVHIFVRSSRLFEISPRELVWWNIIFKVFTRSSSFGCEKLCSCLSCVTYIDKPIFIDRWLHVAISICAYVIQKMDDLTKVWCWYKFKMCSGLYLNLNEAESNCNYISIFNFYACGYSLLPKYVINECIV